MFFYGAHGNRRAESSIHFPQAQRMCTWTNWTIKYHKRQTNSLQINWIWACHTYLLELECYHGLQCSRKSQSRSQFQAMLELKNVVREIQLFFTHILSFFYVNQQFFVMVFLMVFDSCWCLRLSVSVKRAVPNIAVIERGDKRDTFHLSFL